jgi:protein-disulfide isomerase
MEETNFQPEVSNPRQSQNLLIIAVIIGVAIIAAGAVILLNNNSANVAGSDYAGLQYSRTADGGFVLGNPEAPVTIVEFADYACSHCIDYLETMNRFIETYVKTGKAKFEYRTFPTSGREVTVYMGTVAVCLNEQREGAFWDAKDAFYQLAAVGRYDGNSGRVVTEKLGLDYTKVLDCLKTERQVETDLNLGSQLGVGGTPAVLVRIGNGEPKWIEALGRTWDQGGVPYEAIAAAVEQNQ